MKKGLLLIAMATFTNCVFAQSLDEIKKLVILSKYSDAKPLIDKFLSEEKNAAKADGWYYKGVIYNEISKTNASCGNCKMDAFEAFKKYQVMDPKNTWMNEEQNVRLFDLYNGFFDLGSKAYNAKDYATAFDNFKKAGMVGSYTNKKDFSYNGYKFPAFDTSLVLNTAIAARLANNEAGAAEYYEKLAAIDLKGEENMEMYEYLAIYYGKEKNMPAFNAIISKAKKLYPTSDFWDEKTLELVDAKDKKALFAKYEEILATNKTNYTIAYNYCVEMFNYAFATDPKPADYNEAKVKVKNALTSALKIKNTGDANLLMARALYNDSYDAQEEMNKVKGAKPEDVKKRAEKKAAAFKIADECIMYSEAAAAEYAKAEPLKGGQKANYKSCYRLLEDIYSFKGNAAKSAEAKKKGDAIL